MQKYSSSFIGSFKTGDNIAYNLEVLSRLHKQYKKMSKEDKKYIIKPMLLTMASIIEAIMYDFRYRAKNFTREGVDSLTDEIINDMRDGKKDELDKLIAMYEKHNLFMQVPKFYEDLREIKNFRNRIHIQNTKNYKPLREIELFTTDNLKVTAFYLEYIVRFMAINHSRNKNFVEDFKLPWKALLKESDIEKIV